MREPRNRSSASTNIGAMILFLASIVLGEPIALHAPSSAQSNAYQLRETISSSKFGMVVLTGTELRRVGAPNNGKRQVDIEYKVDIAERHFTNARGEKWAQEELADLRIPDHGTLTNRNELDFSDGPSPDAYPILPYFPVAVGANWQVKFDGQDCVYTLERVDSSNGRKSAVIATQATIKNRQGVARRTGTWTIEVASGRLTGWAIRTEATFAGSGKEVIDSVGKLID